MDMGMLEECRLALIALGKRSDIVFTAPSVMESRPSPEQFLSQVLKSFYLKAESFLCELLTSALESVVTAARAEQTPCKTLNIQVIADKQDRASAGYSSAMEDNGSGMTLSELAEVTGMVRGFLAEGGLARLSEEPGGQQLAYSLTLAARLARNIVVISKSRVGKSVQCISGASGCAAGEAREDVECKYGALEGGTKVVCFLQENNGFS